MDPSDNPMGYAPDELDRQYNARASVPDCLPYLQEYADYSAQARRQVAGELGVPYGSHADETLDIFPAAGPAPVYLFIHGGYWRALSKDDSAFMAPAFVRQGVTVVAVNYSLSPGASLPLIVDQCRRALAWVHHNIDRYGGDPERIHVSGSSAGGHLAGMLLAPGWQGALGLPDGVIHSASPISGLFDLRPLVRTHVNAWVRMDGRVARTLSPVFHLPSAACPLLLAWGEHETDEFKRQSDLYAQAWTAHGYPLRTLEVEGVNHFNILMQLRHAESALSRSIFEMMGLQCL